MVSWTTQSLYLGHSLALSARSDSYYIPYLDGLSVYLDTVLFGVHFLTDEYSPTFTLEGYVGVIRASNSDDIIELHSAAKSLIGDSFEDHLVGEMVLLVPAVLLQVHSTTVDSVLNSFFACCHALSLIS